MREDGRLLAIRRADNGTWGLPGGVLELDEVPEAGVAREVLEGTGIRVEVDELPASTRARPEALSPWSSAASRGGVERTSDETTTVDWLTPTEVQERMAEVYAIRLLDALDGAGPMCAATTGAD